MTFKPADCPVTRLPVPASGVLRLGVVADTHIPDRMTALPRQLFDALQGVDHILHAGDICQPGVLTELERIAPVLAVKGNRDYFFPGNWKLPTDRLIEIGNVRIGMTHGHGGLRAYIKEKVIFITLGYHLSRFIDQAFHRFDGIPVKAILFGHSHFPLNQLRENRLLFNPGAVGPDYRAKFGASVGILTVDAHSVKGEIVPLGFQYQKRIML